MAAVDRESDVIVRGGTVVTAQSAQAADVVISGGRIAAVVAAGTAELRGSATIDAGGLLVFAGMVDAHVHFQEPGREEWEGFDTGSAAAAAGGVTTVVDMPIDCDPPTLSAALVGAKVAAIERHSRVDVAIWGGLVPASLDHLEAMADSRRRRLQGLRLPERLGRLPARRRGDPGRGPVGGGPARPAGRGALRTGGTRPYRRLRDRGDPVGRRAGRRRRRPAACGARVRRPRRSTKPGGGRA